MSISDFFFPPIFNWKNLNIRLLEYSSLLIVSSSNNGLSSTIISKQVISPSKLPLVGSMSQDHVCSTSQLGRSKRLPFTDSTRVSSYPLDIIHCDVWVSPILSHGGC